MNLPASPAFVRIRVVLEAAHAWDFSTPAKTRGGPAWVSRPTAGAFVDTRWRKVGLLQTTGRRRDS
jgi:hypothetical protein